MTEQTKRLLDSVDSRIRYVIEKMRIERVVSVSVISALKETQQKLVDAYREAGL